jgi:hypothetical protein
MQAIETRLIRNRPMPMLYDRIRYGLSANAW